MSDIGSCGGEVFLLESRQMLSLLKVQIHV